jgi:hypothetical protein
MVGITVGLMKGTDYILRTVHLWFASVLPLLLAMKTMSFVEETKQLVINTASSNEALKRNEYNWVVYVQHICEEPATALQFLALYDVGFVKDVQFHNDGPFQLVLVFSMAIFLFCLHGLKVLWPKGFIQGEFPHYDNDCRGNSWTMLIAW